MRAVIFSFPRCLVLSSPNMYKKETFWPEAFLPDRQIFCQEMCGCRALLLVCVEVAPRLLEP